MSSGPRTPRICPASIPGLAPGAGMRPPLRGYVSAGMMTDFFGVRWQCHEGTATPLWRAATVRVADTITTGPIQSGVATPAEFCHRTPKKPRPGACATGPGVEVGISGETGGVYCSATRRANCAPLVDSRLVGSFTVTASGVPVVTSTTTPDAFVSATVISSRVQPVRSLPYST